MKNSNNKIYMISPIAMMASVVAAAENSVSPDYSKEAENMVKFYSDSESDSITAVCEPLSMEQMKREDNVIVLNFLYSEFGMINSYTVHHFNNETSVYKIEASKGVYKMILVLDSDNRIAAIDFSMSELSEIKIAA